MLSGPAIRPQRYDFSFHCTTQTGLETSKALLVKTFTAIRANKKMGKGKTKTNKQTKTKDNESIRTFSESQNIVNYSLGLKVGSYISHLSIYLILNIKIRHFILYQLSFFSLNDYKIEDLL